MKNKIVNLKLNVVLPSHLAFAIILVLGFILALYTVMAAQDVVDSAKESVGFNLENRKALNGVNAGKIEKTENAVDIK